MCSPGIVVRLAWLACAFLVAGGQACKNTAKNAVDPSIYADKPKSPRDQTLIFSSHPHVSQQRAYELFQPVIDRINRELKGVALRLQAEPDYPTYEFRLYSGDYHFSLPNPIQTLEALSHGYTIFGKVSDDNQFRGLILARKDRVIEKVTDLRGLKVSFPAATALAACLMPQMFFHEHGLDPSRDIESIFTGNQESSINAVATGITDIGVTWAPPWEIYQRTRPESAAKLRVLWTTEPLINNGLVVRSDVAAPIREQVARVLFSLNQDKEGRRILAAMAFAGFEPASESTFAPVRAFLSRFSAQVRPLGKVP
jgi:phosphonate transport system substrate-binding protein